MSNKEPVSGRLITKSILQIIENLPLTQVIQIRDKCNEFICSMNTPIINEPDEFKTWRIKHTDSVVMGQDNHGGFGLYRKNTK